VNVLIVVQLPHRCSLHGGCPVVKKFDVDPHALAEELSLLLKKERARPKKNQRSFRELSSALYRSRDIRGELWGEYNSAIGKILSARPRASSGKKAEAPKKPAFDPQSKKAEVLFLGVKYATHSFFTPEDTLVVEIPGAELYFRVVTNKVKSFGSRSTFDRSRKVEKVLQSVGMRVAKVRFAEKESRQKELDL